MEKKSDSQLHLTYHPCQPGYKQAGAHYIQLDYSGDCKLGNYISEVFEVQHPKTDAIHIIPDGCNDIVITCNGETVTGWLSPSIQAASKFHFGKVEWILGVRFLPGATYAMFHNNTDYDREHVTDIKLLFPEFEPFRDKLFQSRSFVKRYELFNDFLMERITEHDGVENILRFCIDQLIASRGTVSVEELSQKVGYSDRYIRRLFANHVGHSPKELGNIIRMQCAINYIWENPTTASLGEIASLFGFSDQSHMNREFQKFLGLTSGTIKEYDNWINYLKASSVRNF